MKLALISTPRSGNTWLRLIIAGLYQLKQYAVHTPDSINWKELPDNCIVQLHWHFSYDFSKFLADQGFCVVTIARHPLDVLLSILQFAPHAPATAFWLSGEGGDEAEIHGKLADSEQFLAYATGTRARALLSVTPEWWEVPGVIQIRYEDLVLNAAEGLQPLISNLGQVVVPLEEVLPHLSIEKLRQTSTNNHFWKGQAGHWRDLMPIEVAQAIEKANSDTFKSLGYSTANIE